MDREEPSQIGETPHTPVRMNCIAEEEGPAKSRDSLPVISEQKKSSLYGLHGGNNSSGSLVATKGFSFGGAPNFNASSTSLQPQSETDEATQELSCEQSCESDTAQYIAEEHANGRGHRKRPSFKYVPAPKLPPVSRSRSPIRHTRSPSPDRSNIRNSLMTDSPFNFASSTLQPSQGPGLSVPGSANGGSANRSAMFRKGHRYKHSSVSMNFFQEPEVKIPLNIMKSLPVPNWKDLRTNLTWPTTHIQLGICVFEIMISLYVFALGHTKEWSSLSTLSHFLTYDVLGGMFAVLTGLLSKFEIWKTGTITLPFGLNRIDVLLSFAFAISICFAGLDLTFHVLEEVAVLLAETSTTHQHEDINQTIPHSHHTHLHQEQLGLWYSVIALASIVSVMSYNFIFKHTQYKIKTPLISLAYLLYMSVYPILSRYHRGWDMLTTVAISTFIMSYGIRVAKWTGTILLMGFSTTSINSPLLQDISSENEKVGGVSERMVLKQTKSSLPLATVAKSPPISTHSHFEPNFVKAKMHDSIQSLPLFKSSCVLKNEDFVVSKINFQLFIVLMKVEMKNGTDHDETELRSAIDKLVREYLPNVETTIEIDRIC